LYNGDGSKPAFKGRMIISNEAARQSPYSMDCFAFGKKRYYDVRTSIGIPPKWVSAKLPSNKILSLKFS
jgi:hypothetical protein